MLLLRLFVAWELYTAMNHALSLAWRGTDISKAIGRILALNLPPSKLCGAQGQTAFTKRVSRAKAIAAVLALFTKTGDVMGHLIYGCLYLHYRLSPASDKAFFGHTALGLYICTALWLMHWAQLVIHLRRYQSPPPPGVKAPWILSRGDCCMHMYSAWVWLSPLVALSADPSATILSALSTPIMEDTFCYILSATLVSFILLHRLCYKMASSLESECQSKMN